MTIQIMPESLKGLLGSLHEIGTFSAVIVSLLGTVMGASTKILAERAIRSRYKAISKEADKNFVVSYVVSHPDDDHIGERDRPGWCQMAYDRRGLQTADAYSR